MRVFRLADGTWWLARLHAPAEGSSSVYAGWEAILFERTTGAAAHRLVYRPAGWLREASNIELAEAYEEGDAVRVRWGH